MTKDALLKAVLNGELVTVVEFRGASAQRFEANAKEERAESVCLTYRVELKDGKQQEIKNYLKDAEAKTFDVKAFNDGAMPFKKGERAVWLLKSYGWTERGVKASGTLEPLTDK